MKYKICKLVDGNGSVTYQIKTKGWLVWRWVYAAAGPLGHYEPLGSGVCGSMNPHRKFKNNGPDGFMLVLTMLSLCFIAFVAIVLNPIHKKNIEKLHKPKPIDRTKIVSSNVTGNVESIHPWGRTEVVPMKGIELEYFEYCDEWVMYGDVVQPVGRKGYFMPVLKGHLDLNVKEMTQTWIEYGGYETGSAGIIGQWSWHYRNLAPITSIFLGTNTNWAQYSHIALYGIA